MKLYYETICDNRPGVRIITNGYYNFRYKNHFHKKIELFIIRNGSYRVSVNEETFIMNSGDILYSDSYNLHSYEEPLTEEIDGLCIQIPRDYIESFTARHKTPVTSHLISNPELVDKLLYLAKEYLPKARSENIKKGACELMFSLLEEHLTFDKDIKKNEFSLIQRILLYIDENISNDLSLKTIATALGYSPAYLSRVFNQYVQSSLTDYINTSRINKVEELINLKSMKKTTAIYEAGFNSYQTYYRNKEKYTNNELLRN